LNKRIFTVEGLLACATLRVLVLLPEILLWFADVHGARTRSHWMTHRGLSDGVVEAAKT
jgi:hypothetical protein